MSLINNFFKRSLDTWESHRTYLYPNKNSFVSSVTKYTWIEEGEGFYKVEWDNVQMNSKGSMCIEIGPDVLKRDVGYFTKSPTISQVIKCTYDCLHTETIYNGISYDELITFVDDRTRIRRTIARKWNGTSYNKLVLLGNYTEIKNG